MPQTNVHSALLADYGLLLVCGEDARAFLHAQLTNDIAHLDGNHARRAAWCTAQGRVLATFLVLPWQEDFILQLARDLAESVARRLALYVLRSKVKVAEVSAQWAQIGVAGDEAERALVQAGLPVPAGALEIMHTDGRLVVRLGSARFLILALAAGGEALRSHLAASTLDGFWREAEIDSGTPLITAATQDRFVPQMLDLERLGAVDFRKGCYPGQEVVARTQYRGQVKRRLYRIESDAPLAAGEPFSGGGAAQEDGGVVVNAQGRRGLAVLPVAAVESGAELRTLGGAVVRVLGRAS